MPWLFKKDQLNSARFLQNLSFFLLLIRAPFISSLSRERQDNVFLVCCLAVLHLTHIFNFSKEMIFFGAMVKFLFLRVFLYLP